jgi:hypothetical protein
MILGRSLLNRIYNLLKINKMSETKEDVKKYQWNKGDNFGKIVEVKDITGEFTNFTDGSKIFTEIIHEFLTEFIDGEVPLPGAVLNDMSLPSVNPVEPSIINEITKTKEKKVQRVAPVEPIFSPLQVLVKTISKKNVEAVDVKLNINIPKKKVIDMLVENSEEEKSELVNAVVNNAIAEIEINKLQEFLQIEITNFINKYYE